MSFENLEWTTDRLWIPTVDYAGDVIILEETKENVNKCFWNYRNNGVKMT